MAWQREMTIKDPNEFLMAEYSKYKKDVAEGDPMEFDDWLAGSDIHEIVNARELAKAQERKMPIAQQLPEEGVIVETNLGQAVLHRGLWFKWWPEMKRAAQIAYRDQAAVTSWKHI